MRGILSIVRAEAHSMEVQLDKDVLGGGAPFENEPQGRASRYTFTVNGAVFSSHDPNQDGRQLLQAAGYLPASDHVLIVKTRPGSRVVGLDEQVDLAEPGNEDFFAFLSDREFNFTVNEVGYVWGAPTISEESLRALTMTPDDHELVLDRADGDLVIHPGASINLAERGTEHIYSEKRLVTVFYQDDPIRLERGRYTGAQLSTKFGVPAGYVLDLVEPDGNFKAIRPEETVKVRDGMRFASHPPCGHSS